MKTDENEFGISSILGKIVSFFFFSFFLLSWGVEYSFSLKNMKKAWIEIHEIQNQVYGIIAIFILGLLCLIFCAIFYILIKDELSNWFNHRQNRYNQLKEEKIGVQTKILCTIICFYLFDWFLKYVTI